MRSGIQSLLMRSRSHRNFDFPFKCCSPRIALLCRPSYPILISTCYPPSQCRLAELHQPAGNLRLRQHAPDPPLQRLPLVFWWYPAHLDASTWALSPQVWRLGLSIRIPHPCFAIATSWAPAGERARMRAPLFRPSPIRGATGWNNLPTSLSLSQTRHKPKMGIIASPLTP